MKPSFIKRLFAMLAIILIVVSLAVFFISFNKNNMCDNMNNNTIIQYDLSTKNDTKTKDFKKFLASPPTSASELLNELTFDNVAHGGNYYTDKKIIINPKTTPTTTSLSSILSRVNIYENNALKKEYVSNDIDDLQTTGLIVEANLATNFETKNVVVELFSATNGLDEPIVAEISFSIDFPSPSDVKYNLAWDVSVDGSSQIKIIQGAILDAKLNGEIVNARIGLFANAESNLIRAFNTLKTTRDNLANEITQLTQNISYTKDNISAHKEKLISIETAFSNLTIEQKNSLSSETGKLQTFKNAFFAANFSELSNNVQIEIPSLERNSENYGYYIKVVEKTDNKEDISNAIKKVSGKNIPTTRYEIKIYDGDTDVSSNFSNTQITIKIKITLGDVFENTKDISSGYFVDGTFHSTSTTIDGDYAKFAVSGIGNDYLLFKSFPKSYTWIIILSIFLAAVVIGGVVFLILFFARKKSVSKEQVDKLQQQVSEKQYLKEVAQKAKEETDALNRQYAEEDEKRREEAIQRVKEERKKHFADKYEALRLQAELNEQIQVEQDLAEFQRLATEKSLSEQKKNKKKNTKTKKEKPTKESKAPKAEKKEKTIKTPKPQKKDIKENATTKSEKKAKK